MSMKGKGGKGGKAKGGGKSHSGGESIAITKTKARATASINDTILTLREALFDAEGRNRDVTASIAPAFMKYDRKGLDCTIDFAPKLSKEELTWTFGLVKETMEGKYDEAGYGWDDADKLEQLRAPEGRFLLVREALSPAEKGEKPQAAEAEAEAEAGEAESGKKDKKEKKSKKTPPPPPTKKGPLMAVAHFRFTVQGEWVDEMIGEPSLVLWDVAIDTDARRKGLGRHLLVLLELIARQTRMRFLSLPVINGDDETRDWVLRGGRGFAVDTSLEALVGFDSQEEGFQVYCKELAPPAMVAAATAAAAPTAAPPATAAAATAAKEEEGGKKDDKAN